MLETIKGFAFNRLFAGILFTMLGYILMGPNNSQAGGVEGAWKRHSGAITGTVVGGVVGAGLARKATEGNQNQSNWTWVGAAGGAAIGGAMGDTFIDKHSSPGDSALERHAGAIGGTLLGGFAGHKMGGGVCDDDPNKSECEMTGMLAGAGVGSVAGAVIFDK